MGFYLQWLAMVVLVGIANELPSDLSIEVAAVAVRVGEPYFAIQTEERFSNEVKKAIHRQGDLAKDFQTRFHREQSRRR